MKLHIRIKTIKYSNTFIGGNCKKTKCIIYWINPITGNIQRSVGVAKCSPDDKSDTIKGQRIAESRAKINMWNTYNSSIVYILGFSVRRHINFINHEKQHIHDLINNVKTK